MDDMRESARPHEEDCWVVACTNSNERPIWLAGFDADQPVWVASIDEAAIYGHHDADRARLRCTNMPDLDDVLYAVCHSKDGDRNGAMRRGVEPRTDLTAFMGAQ